MAFYSIKLDRTDAGSLGITSMTVNVDEPTYNLFYGILNGQIKVNLRKEGEQVIADLAPVLSDVTPQE